ncbi:methionyl-tRNA formyltransferase [Propionispira arboris]|uniref:Methionyl-tRNA formyltransferase n=1 Tax=Propionispira arboris TaxID=84035 RepID=A0A1H7CQ82_9FIRM|nr:methionyl-tRNA formyltransferase [Propionispira arboris]SEJ87945.1 methionyl-tRNA formyltransferase [Propionispira arboris]
MNNIVVSSKSWHRNYIREIEQRTNSNIVYIEKQELLLKNFLEEYQPRYVFFPHWSYIITPEIYENFECVIFHMTDLPFGRGGSPLQNLIVREIYETKLSALRCNQELDAGDIYMKKKLSLWGSAEEIYLRAAELTKEMIIELIQKDIKPEPQRGAQAIFKRRTPLESDISKLNDLGRIFDYIRMLDADQYPNAFLNTEQLHMEFTRASLKNGYIQADVKIKLRTDKDE